MARTGRHAAADGSFRRSAGSAALRGGALLALALILGIVLLNAADDNDAFSPVTAGGSQQPAESETTLPAETTTTTTQPLRPPAEVKVLAANGTATRGLAGQYKDRLSAAGYNALAPTDASKKPVAKSVVYFTAGYEGEAKAVADLLEIATTAPMPQEPPVASLQSAHLLVLVGTDKVPAATTTTSLKRGAAATTTTAPRRTTTTAGD